MVTDRLIVNSVGYCTKKGCDGLAILERVTYHFKNTGEPYMLRRCLRCGQYSVIYESKGR